MSVCQKRIRKPCDQVATHDISANKFRSIEMLEVVQCEPVIDLLLERYIYVAGVLVRPFQRVPVPRSTCSVTCTDDG